MEGKFIAMTRGSCPGLWSYYEFFSTLDEEDDEEDKGVWKIFAKKDDAVEHLYKHFIPALYMNGEPSAEYPLNKFSPKEKGLESDSFYDGRDGRHWMLDSEGLHVVYCCAIGENNEAGVGIHWGNDIELALPVPPRPEAYIGAYSTQDVADMKAIEGAIRDGMRFGKNRISVRSDSQRIVDRFNQEFDDYFQFGEGNHSGRFPGSHYRKNDGTCWEEITKLVNQLMCINIQLVDKTDKNYHRARKLAHEGRGMVKVYSQHRSTANKRTAK